MKRRAVIGAALAFLAGCSSKFKSYFGPEVTRVEVYKGAREMRLLSGNVLLKSYDFELGFSPKGHKVVEGDGRTPEGVYYIDRLNPNSRFHLSVGISYPNQKDVARARAMGRSPGGDIFIHGTPDKYVGESDWTWGCIAVSNDEIEEIYSMVRKRTPVVIFP